MRRTLSIIVAATLLVVVFTACPSQSELDKAAGASRELAHDTVDGERVVKILYEQNRIGLTRKDEYARLFQTISAQGANFNSVVVNLDKDVKAGQLPANAAQLISENYAPIASAISQIFAMIGEESPTNAKQLQSATKALKADDSAIRKVSQ